LMERKLVKEKERTELGKVNVLAIFRTEKNRQMVGFNQQGLNKRLKKQKKR
jgi:hypothetical protein